MSSRKRTFENRLQTALTTLGRISREVDPSARNEEESATEESAEKSKDWRPWDREQLMERAASFRSLYWFGKPRPISAMECARRGWRCYAKDTLECSLCGAKLVFALPEAAATAIGGEALMASAVQEFLGKLSSEHRAGCKWKEQVCPENLNSLPAISDSEIKRLFKSRANSLLSLTRLPVLTAAWIEENVDADVRRHLMELLDSKSIGFEECSLQYPRVNSIPMRTTRLIALAGWDLNLLDYRIKDKNIQAASLPRDPDNPPAKNPRIEVEVIRDENGEKSAVLRCKYCTAIVPLWLYEDKPITPSAAQSLPNSPASLRSKSAQGLLQNRPLSPLKTVPGPFGNPGAAPPSPASLSLASSIAGGPIFSKAFLSPEQLVWPSARNFSPRSAGAESVDLTPRENDGDVDNSNDQVDSASRSLLTGLPIETENGSGENPSGKIDRRAFDPFRSHRDSCCWVNGGKASGWVRTLKALLPKKTWRFKSSSSAKSPNKMTPKAVVKTFLPINPA